MRGIRLAGSLVVLGALLGGCKDDGSDEEPLSTLETLSAGVAEAACSALIACACTDEVARADCETAFTEMVRYDLAMELTQAPGMKIDPAAVQPCIEAVRTSMSTCEPARELCAGVAVLVGTRAEGDRCSADRECAAGLGCHRGTATCVAAPGAGQSCEWIGCPGALHCEPDTLLCVEALPADQPCSTEWDAVPCQEGLFCDTASTPTCRPLIADGAACTDDDECLHGWCNDLDDADPSNDRCASAGLCGYDGREE